MTLKILFLKYVLYFVDPSVLQETLAGHTDAVWGLSIHTSKTQLLSNSSDGTIKLWNPGAKSPLLNTFSADTGKYLTLYHFLLSSEKLIITCTLQLIEKK